MKKITFTTVPGWNEASGFGCPSKGFAGVCDNEVSCVQMFPVELEGQEFLGSYDKILTQVKALPGKDRIHVAIVLFGNAGGENLFLTQLQKLIDCPIVGGGAAFDVAAGNSGLIPGSGQAAVLLITDDRYTYTTQTKCIHDNVLERCTLTLADPRTILTINGTDAATYLAEKRSQLGLQEDDFEHLTLSDLRNVNAHLSCVDGTIKSGRDVHETMLLRYIPHNEVYESIRSFYDDQGAIVFGCAGLGGILDRPLDTNSLGLFLFGEVCTVEGVAEFGNLMLSKLMIQKK